MADEPSRVSMDVQGRKQVHSTYPDGTETIEEFDKRNGVLLVRRIRRPRPLGGEGEWVYEVGAPPQTFDPSSDMLAPSSQNPIFCRKDTKESFQWRVRNLPYPKEVFSVFIDHEKEEIVIRTSNKKYYKRIQVPDLLRLKLSLEEGSLSWFHQFNTLVVSYAKPREVLEAEVKVQREADQNALNLNSLKLGHN
mmetsp:Transcript_4843/g.9713  ORF Transcript_4843/g.9713 Transcript_4843/m.9713 type:complete len:193 (+) Transcript_4843:201-779(+)